MIIIRGNRAFDTAEQKETEMPTHLLSHAAAPNGHSPRTQLQTIGSNLGEEFLINRPVARKPDRGSHLCPTWWKRYDPSWTASF